MKKINSQEDFDQFVSIPDWADAFVRECYLLSPSFINTENQGLFAPNYPPTMKVLICIQDIDYPGIELLFVEVEDIILPFNRELDPFGKCYKNYLEFSFIERESYVFRCKEIHYKMLDQACWGKKIRYGNESFYTEEGFLNTNLFED